MFWQIRYVRMPLIAVWCSPGPEPFRRSKQATAKRKALNCWGSFLTPTYGIAMFSGSERILAQSLERGNEKS
jgi:hypothetical protein